MVGREWWAGSGGQGVVGREWWAGSGEQGVVGREWWAGNAGVSFRSQVLVAQSRCLVWADTW